MSEASKPGDGISFALIVRSAGPQLAATVSAWASALAALGRDWELLLIDEQHEDGLADQLAALAEKIKHVRVVAAPAERGTGASLRALLATAQQPIFGFAETNYPYAPSDLPRMLHEYGRKETIYDRDFEVVLVNGCRSGATVPGIWRGIGFGVRWFARLVLGLPLELLPGWLGWREHARSWWCWLVYGNPFHDPQCGFKLVRKSLLDSIPIQSDGDFTHTELIGKITFLTNLTAEVVLAARPDPIPKPAWQRTDRQRVFRQPQFRQPVPAS